MSVLPLGSITDVRPLEYARRVSDSQQPPTLATKASVNYVAAAEELGFSMAMRGRARVAERESDRPSRREDPRYLMQLMLRTGRHRGVYAAFNQEFWDNLIKRADELIQMYRQRTTVDAPDQDTGEDPFKWYVHLLEAQGRAKDSDPEVAKRLDAVLDQVWEKHTAQIVAGFNTLTPLLRFAKDVEEWDWLRKIYLETIVPGDIARTFKALLERFLPGRMRSALDALRNAIVADLGSPIVCADRNRWHQEYLDLMDNRRLASLVASASEFCTTMQMKDPEPDTVINFVGNSLELAAAPTDRKFVSLCTVVVPEEELNEIVRMRVRGYLKKYVPLWLWSSPEARDVILFPPTQRLRA